jgi:Fur family transcriptional regulator, ferric uptake regulator
MTVPHSGPPLAAPTLPAALDTLREQGLRVSAARRLVLEALFASDEPVPAERIASGLDGRLPACDLASVYRNLETLEQLGLIRHVHLGHGPGLYALAGRREREYLVCERCYALRALEPSALDPLRELIRGEFGFGAAFTHFPIVGLCSNCERSEQ